MGLIVCGSKPNSSIQEESRFPAASSGQRRQQRVHRVGEEAGGAVGEYKVRATGMAAPVVKHVAQVGGRARTEVVRTERAGRCSERLVEFADVEMTVPAAVERL